MICPNCKTRNPVGNKFCRECGSTLAPSENVLQAEEAARVEAERTQERVAELLLKAAALRDARKYDEAIEPAREATQLLPTSTSAFSLLATLYERAHKNAEAIAAMEKVVALNPGSQADLVKLDQLKRGVHIIAREPQKETRPSWIPVAVAGAVMALVLGMGITAMNGSAKRNTPVRVRPAVVPSVVGAYSPASPVVPTGPPPAASTKAYIPPPPASETRADPFTPLAGRVGAVDSTRASTARSSSAMLPPLSVPRRRTTVSANGGMVPPASVTFKPGSGPEGNGTLPAIGDVPSDGGQGGFGSGERLSVGPPTTNGGTAPANPNPPMPNGNGGTPGDAGYIRIQVGPPSGGTAPAPARSNPPSDPPTPSGSEATSNPMARARRLQSSGKYNEAIAAYRDALAQGAGGDAHQGIGQCLQRLGNDGGAKLAYQDAVAAYEAQAHEGGANSYKALLAQRGIASCRAALEVLGG